MVKSGVSKAAAVARVAEEYAKKTNRDEDAPVVLLEKQKDYVVKFQFLALDDVGPGVNLIRCNTHTHAHTCNCVSPQVSLHDVSFGYESGRCLFERVDLGLDSNSRVAIVGPNGVGKSTLLKLITGELKPCSGEVLHAAAYGPAHPLLISSGDSTPVTPYRCVQPAFRRDPAIRTNCHGLHQLTV